MSETKLESLKDLMTVVNSSEIGLVILDTDYNIRVWNLFMVNHSAKSADAVIGKNLFEEFPKIAISWFCDKAQQAINQKSKLLSTWQERPYLFKFVNVCKQAKSAAFMYQNITFIPLTSVNGEVKNFAITINDVTNISASTQSLDAVISEYSQNS